MHGVADRTPAKVFEALHEIAVAVGGVLDQAALARIVVDRAAALLGGDAAALYVWDAEASVLRPLYSNDARMRQAVDAALEPGRGVAGRAFVERAPVAVNDYGAWDKGLARAVAHGVQAALAVPLVVAERVVGALVVRSYTPRSYGAEQQHLLALLGAQVAPALEAARLLTASEQLVREAAERTAELAASERRLSALVASTRDVVTVLDRGGVARYASPTVEVLWGCLPRDVEGRDMVERIHPEDVERARAALVDILSGPLATVSLTEVRVQHTDGEWRDFELILSNQLPDPAVAGVVATYHDITERKSFEHDLRYLAYHDPLLDVPNRVLFMERLEHALATHTPKESLVAVLFIDLDDFKLINDSLGHRAGDQLLIAVSQRLKASVRERDTVARLGGDEFTVLLDGVTGLEAAEKVAWRILESLQEPILLDGHEVVQSASVGMAISGTVTDTADALIRDADLAMYRAKANGKGRYEIFERGMDAHAAERLALVGDLRRALERGEMRVYYQPMVRLETGQIRAAEALVRWQHPTRGLVSPDQFIPLAEETGLIIPLGDWVLEEACRQTRAWHQQYPALPPLVINVNLSARQLQQADLVQRVAAVLDRTGLDPVALTLEVTESVAMQNPERTIANLHALKQLGVRLAVDDFGTGYSSLTYLKRFPLDSIKIDRSFVDGLGADLDDTAIVRAVIALARALNLGVTAEGVETAEQVAELRALACEHAQGYYFARPAPAEVLSEALAARSSASGRLRAA